ncbi:MAG: NAD(P)H-dependent oxidoreductase subunit E [Nitrospirae bacterium]|jgi:NADH:ubiquinone oxidoreductase subunit E|nr:NAD(P)H-dependent oxidoreductase subunit E [Nitrospirota bacterium]
MDIEAVSENSQIGSIGSLLNSKQKKRGILIHLLQQIQEENGYIPEEIVKKLSSKLSLSMSEIFSVASFYKMFRFTPRGKKLVKVCLGTACYVRGSKKVLNTLENEFQIKSGETSSDLSITLETVGCVGCCGLAPVTTVNDEVVGDITSSGKIEGLIKFIRKN